jgi:Ca2+-binding RTX toxin-like protein
MDTPFRIEPLEARQLLSASVNAMGTLHVYGTPGDDVIAVTVNADQSVTVDVDGTTLSPFTGVKRIRVRAGAGDDSVTVDESAAMTLLSAFVDGGRGDDTIVLGNENNFVIGGLGGDLITAGDGNNVVHGGLGHNQITVGNGSNIVITDGASTIHGGAGNDTLLGGPGADSITGGGGNDLIWGRDGNDTLVGNVGDLSGHDVIYTGMGTTNVVEPGPDDRVNPGGRIRPPAYRDLVIYLESLTSVPPAP